MSEFSLETLDQIIRSRAQSSEPPSYTRQLLAKGSAYCARKMGEEAIETIIAVASQDNEAVVNEAADLLYHLLVTLRARQVDLSDVMTELDRRTDQSGVAEKAARTPS